MWRNQRTQSLHEAHLQSHPWKHSDAVWDTEYRTVFTQSADADFVQKTAWRGASHSFEFCESDLFRKITSLLLLLIETFKRRKNTLKLFCKPNWQLDERYFTLTIVSWIVKHCGWHKLVLSSWFSCLFHMQKNHCTGKNKVIQRMLKGN